MGTIKYKWELLMLLWLAFFLNQADRQIFSVVLPLIRKDLQLSDAQLGLIATILIWTYGLFVPVAGFLGDRLSRSRIIGFSLLFWSAATLLTGLCGTLLQFIILRGIATGGGEAFYAPSANALLSDKYKENRSFALSVHQSAVYAGIILSGLIAGYIGEYYGWRKAFFIFGFFGLIIGTVILKRLQTDTPPVDLSNKEGAAINETVRLFIKTPTAILLTLGFACMVFVNVGYLTWMPSFLADKFHLSLHDAGFSSLFYHHAGAFLGVLAGGKFSDKMALSNPRYRLGIQGVALLLASPFVFLIGQSDSTIVTYLALFIFGIFRGVYDSNIFASLYEVIPNAIRSSSSGLMLMSAFLVGALSPFLLGMLKPILGMSVSISLLSTVYVLGGILILIATLFYFKRDKLRISNLI